MIFGPVQKPERHVLKVYTCLTEYHAPLRAEGCDQVQGYLVGRPLAAEAAVALLGDAPARAAA